MKIRRTKARRIVLFILGVVCTCALAGTAYEALSTYAYRRQRRPGKMVDVGGYREYIDCRGQGSPTILFDSGLGDASDVWRDIHDKAAAISRACVYDRAGLGWSDRGPSPRSSGQMAKELRNLLSNSGERGPYVLVAHSMAGYTARIFASQNSKEAAGILLLDVSHPDQNDRESGAANKDRYEFMKKQGWWARLAPLGITRILGHCEFSRQNCGRSYWTTLDEFGPFNEISPGEVRAAGTLDSIPLIAISHDPDVEIKLDPSEVTRRDEAVDSKMQRELSELSTRGCLLVAVGSRHYVQDARPDLVLRSLEALVSQARRGPGHDPDSLCAKMK